jgi:gliding motility-associated-like protein
MVKKLLFFLLFLTVNFVNAQDPNGLTLSEARPFCSDSGAQFPNTHNGSNSLSGPVLVEETLPDFGCLFPQLRVNPTWYFLKIETSGDLNLKLISYTSNDVRMDTDFIAWGPFSEDVFNEIINNGDGQELTGDTIIGCEKSTSQPFEEDIIINDAIVDEYYIVMITNYSGNEGYSTLEEQNPDDPNTGTTDCFVNDAPTITSTSVTTATEDIAYTYTITTEDVDGDVVTVSASGLPSWLTLSGNTLSGTPTEGDTGSEITITATDDGDGALTATQIFTIVVTPVNDAPVAVADTATVLEDAEATSIDVLANDTDEEGDPLTLFSVTTSGTGTVTVNGTLVEYTPAVDFNGTEEVSYTVSDGLLTSAGVLTITVTPVNDAPIAIEDIASVLENAFMTSIDVISNDIDVDGDILTLTDVSYSGLGTVVVNVDEFSVDYTPAPNFIGTEVINYSVTDGILSSEGVLKINVITPEEIQITKPELNIPKFFTPNGDGINDTWNIKWNNVSNYRIIEVNIYNRYGKILKKLTSFDNGWDGTYNGKLMPPNDYWVAIKLVPMNETKRIIIETSNFSLIR